MLETFVNFVAESPIAFVLVAGVAIIVLGLVGKFTLPRIGEIGIEPDNRRLAVGVGLLLVALGAGLTAAATGLGVIWAFGFRLLGRGACYRAPDGRGVCHQLRVDAQGASHAAGSRD